MSTLDLSKIKQVPLKETQYFKEETKKVQIVLHHTAGNTFEGTNFSTETVSGFDTTISNTLEITAQWGTASSGDSIYSEIFTLNKTY